ncbi:MAG TPA: SDR family oxidoreductase [Casimicrobiaceae bacterium]|nr:SDR family oxidoreductase [Casimicrobiaceae bacterium]
MIEFDRSHWALILGGSSGFGLATALKLARHGMNVMVVHRDRRGAMARIEPSFDRIRATGAGFRALNLDALSPEGRSETLDGLAGAMGDRGRVRLLLHSIAFGNLKPIAPDEPDRRAAEAASQLAAELGVPAESVSAAVARLIERGVGAVHALQATSYGDTLLDEEDMARTIHAMGTSLLAWVQDLHRLRLFAGDARVLGLTSEGNTTAWKGYAAVAAAKAALESVSRAIAVEYAPYGIRSNIIQAGVTSTPALKLIPGSAAMQAVAQRRNPFRRTTTPEAVADFIALMCLDEAAWVNGALIRVDGGEHIAPL